MPIKSILQICLILLTATLLVACPSSSGSSSSSQSSSGDNNDNNDNDNNVSNVAPVAAAGADQTVDVGVTVSLDASASSDSDGNITSYSWSQTAGTDVSINNPNSELATFVVPESASGSNLSFELTIVDDDNASASDSLTVVVSESNDDNDTDPNADDSVPVARAGDDQRVNEGTIVELNASASSAADGSSIDTYQWTQIDGTAVQLENSSSAQAYFEAPEVSDEVNLVFRLTVTDSNGAQDLDSTIITVLNNEAPTASASAETQAYENTSIEIDASASSDSDGSIATYLWEQTAGPTASIADPAAESTTVAVPIVDAESIITLRLTVTDNDGAQSTDEISINIIYNNPPTANAGTEAQVNEGDRVELDGSASSDAEGSALTYLWQQIDNSGYSVTLDDANTSKPSFTAPGPVAADTNLSFQLTVTDSFGKSSNANVNVTVIYNNPPTADAGANQQANEIQLVQLNGSASSDAEDSNLTYFWQQVDSSGYSVSLSDASSANPSFTTPQVAADTNLSFKLTVTDSLGKSSDDNLSISIVYNNPPTANAGNSGQANENQSIQLNGSASVDSEDSNLTYFWQQTDSSDYSVSLSDAHSANPTFITPEVAANTNLSFQLSVTDSLGKNSRDNVTISVIYNNPPVANAGNNQDVNDGASVELDGSASSDIEASALAYLWQQVDSSGYAISLSDANSARPSFTAPAVLTDTNLSFQLTVTDSLGKSDDANLTISVIYNNPPTARVGAHQEVRASASVSLDGSASSDSEDSSLAYIWQQVDSSGYVISLSDATIAQPSFTAPEVTANAELIFQLTVTDSLGKSDDANSTISVVYKDPPSANAGNDQTVAEKQLVELDGSASSDSDGNITSYSWQQVDSSGYAISLSDANSTEPSFTTPEVAADTSLTFQLTVTDNDGNQDSDTVVTNIVYNSPPTADAGANIQANENASVQLYGGGSNDIEDSNLAYLWQQVDSSGYAISLSDVNSANPTFITPEVAANSNLSFQLSVSDSGGKSSDANVTVTVIYNNPPVASTSADQSVSEGASVELDGSASGDIEGSALSYLWQQVDSSGYAISLGDANSAKATFTAPDPVAADTELVFQLTVTDSLGKSSDANSTISVVYNNPPVAQVSADQSVDESVSAQLDGSSSSDVEDSSLSYLWQQVDSSGYSISLSDASSASPTFTTPIVAADTNLVFQLTVTDSLGKSSDANSTISVIYNSPPTAGASAVESAYESVSVALDGSASSDSDGSIVAYSWQQVDDSGYAVTLANPASAQASFTAPEVATDTNLTFQLTASDNLGKSHDANVTITILNNNPPVASVSAATQVDEGVTIQLDGSASSDVEDSALTYLWQQVDSSGYTVTLSDANSSQPSFTTPVVATNTNIAFQLTVSDKLGKSSTDSITITIIYNAPPSANAGANQSFYEGTSVELDGSASSDSDGTIASYSWQQVDSSAYAISLSDANTATPSFTTPVVSADTDLIFQLTVSDNLGKSSDANVSITVFDNLPPSASAGADQSLYESESVQLVGSGSSDSDGSIASYSWQQIDSSGYTISLDDANSADPTFTAPEVTTETELTFQLTVTDDDGVQDSDTVVISITDNNPPSANVGSDQSVNEGASVQLNGSASSDVEDSALVYSWQQIDSSGYSITLSDADSATPSFTAPNPVAADTELIFQLTVSDSLGKSATDTLSITVIYNAPPLAKAGTNQSVDEGASVELDGSASSDSEDAASALGYLWQQVDSSGYSITLNNANTAKPTFTAPNPVAADTDLIFQLTVSDSLGKSADANVSITVIYNNPPIANAGTDQSVFENTTATLDGSASSDSENSNLAYSWQQVDSSGHTINLSDATVVQPTFTAPNVAADTELIFRLTVTDSLGKSGEATVAVTVLDNEAPVANAGADQSVYEGTTASLDGSASSDRETSNLDYSWQQIDSSGYLVNLNNATSAQPSFTAPNVDADIELSFQLTVTDAVGESSTDSLSITVLYAPPFTVSVNANNAQSIGTIASLRGATQGSHLIESYLWQETTAHGIVIDRADSTNASFVVPSDLYADDILSFRFTATDAAGVSVSATTSITIAQRGSLKWHYDIGSRVSSSPAIDPDGAVYFGAANGTLYVLNPEDGSLKWTFTAEGGIEAPPTIGADGTVYFGDLDGYLYAVAPPADGGQSGIQKWRYNNNNQFDEHSSVSIAADGTLYFGSRDSSLYALDPDGNLQWSYAAGGAIIAAPAISAEGTIYFGSGDTNIYAINPPSAGGSTGELYWKYETTHYLTWTSPAIGADGTVYNGSYGDSMYAIYDNGRYRLKYSVDADVHTSAAIGADGTIYFGSEDDRMYAFKSSTGSEEWNYPTDGKIFSSPLLGANDRLYFGSSDDYIYALDAEDGERKWRYDAGSLSGDSSAALAPDGTLFIGGSDGLFAIHTTAAGLAADSPWPKFGQNNLSTGRVNLAPSADAGSEQTVNPGATVNLDASASADSDGVIIDYYWRETSGYGINIIGNSSAQAHFTAPTPSANDTLTIELTVTDDHGTPNTTTLNINIEI